ncbi:MAG: CDP-archaeol synthase [bacterium]|nr:CDP-archaeol synthase [bacterium]
MKKNIFIIRPNIVDCMTLSGLFFASWAAVLAIAGKFAFSLSLLYVAMLADAFDGFMARKYGTERSFGRYLDGFVDVYDYLVVPSIFLYCWGFSTWYYSIILVIFMMCGVIRLSVFNDVGNIKDEDDGLSYWGMPVFWSTFFIGGAYILSWTIEKAYLFPFIAALFAVFGVLMVYNGRFYKFKSWKVMLSVILGGSILFALDGFGMLNIKSLLETEYAARAFSLIINEHTATALLVLIPGVIGGILHMIVVTKDWFQFLKIPVCKPLFGENKTIRGFILMPLFSIPGAFLTYKLLEGSILTIPIETIHFAIFGAIIGITYVIFELPNSFLKRRMGIAPGEESNKFRAFFVFLDQMDSTIGGAVVAIAVFQAPVLTGISILIVGPVLALCIKKLLYMLRLKKSSR